MIRPTNERTETKLKTQIKDRLRATGYGELIHNIDVEAMDRTVRLKGHVSRFYLKQLAQHALLELPEVTTIENELVVAGPRDHEARDHSPPR